jgi:hypothetical protein
MRVLRRGDAFLLGVASGFGVVLSPNEGRALVFCQLQNGKQGLVDVESVADGIERLKEYAWTR